MEMKKYFYIVLSLVILSGCANATSSRTSHINNLIEKEQWEEAKKTLEIEENKNIENYNVLYTYVDARLDYITEKETGKISYEPILKKLNTINLDTYTGIYKDEIIAFKDDFNKERLAHYDKDWETQIAKGKEAQKILDKEKSEQIDTLLKNKDYEELIALTVYDKEDNPDVGAIHNYALSQIGDQKGDRDMMIYCLSLIPMSYDGKFSDFIMEKKLSIQSEDKWLEEEQERERINRVPTVTMDVKSSPSIGMTAEEVRDSSWGSPT